MNKKKGNSRFMKIKLDLEKAFDRLNWNFIRNTLLEMRLPQLMVEVIILCISSCLMQILWNGELQIVFILPEASDKGNPLSPCIFKVSIEQLSQLIEEMVRVGDRRPLQVCKNGPQISSLFFTNDIVFFAEATEAQA